MRIFETVVSQDMSVVFLSVIFISCTKFLSANGYHCSSVLSGNKSWAQLKLILDRKP